MKTRDLNTESFRLPAVPESATVVYSEHGRVLDNKTNGGNYDVCYQAFGYIVVNAGSRTFWLYSRNGSGDFSQRIDSTVVDALAGMDSNCRFFVLHALYCAASEARRDGAASESRRYQQAFAGGRLRKRKNRGQDSVKVWIES